MSDVITNILAIIGVVTIIAAAILALCDPRG